MTIIEETVEYEATEYQKRTGAPMPLQNRQTLRRRLHFLMKKATPGNWAWHELINRYGFDADFTDADHGEAPMGAD